MRPACSAERKPLRRTVRWGAVAGSALAAFVVVSGALAGFSSLTAGVSHTIVTKRIFLGPRSLAAQDLRDASSGAETNKSDSYSYADGTVATTSTAIASRAAFRSSDVTPRPRSGCRWPRRTPPTTMTPRRCRTE